MQSTEQEDIRSLEKARKQISEKKILLIAVDSNAFFEGLGSDRRVSFNQAWMGKFRQLATRGERLLMSAVWDEEVRRHFNNSIDSQVQVKLPKFAKIGSNSDEINNLNNRAISVRNDAQALVEREWDSVKKSFNTEIVEIPSHPDLARKIFSLWAENNWPFEKRKEKRDEFQDAFALLSLHAYVEDLRSQPTFENTAVLVVTADGGCRSFCSQTDSLIPCSDIAAAVNFLTQREEIIRLSDRSQEISKCLTDPGHVILERLSESFSENMNQGFPPRNFYFIKGNQKISGWLRTFVINSIFFLPSGPRKSAIEVIHDQGNYLQIRGRLIIGLTISLNEPQYSEGTACPSDKAVISDFKCTLTMEFSAAREGEHWYGGVSDIPSLLSPLAEPL